ncbi:unnamed protein product [Lactuca virosa]|uniref:Uncharacterized protein n=1 Tax=Lactuca virosa TaxID=75947 RepID=A0AAU9LS37_9ASTR|nr:unnamed protein product [Lactuca virosa]
MSRNWRQPKKTMILESKRSWLFSFSFHAFHFFSSVTSHLKRTFDKFFRLISTNQNFGVAFTQIDTFHWLLRRRWPQWTDSFFCQSDSTIRCPLSQSRVGGLSSFNNQQGGDPELLEGICFVEWISEEPLATKSYSGDIKKLKILSFLNPG